MSHDAACADLIRKGFGTRIITRETTIATVEVFKSVYFVLFYIEKRKLKQMFLIASLRYGKCYVIQFHI